MLDPTDAGLCQWRDCKAGGGEGTCSFLFVCWYSCWFAPSMTPHPRHKKFVLAIVFLVQLLFTVSEPGSSHPAQQQQQQQQQWNTRFLKPPYLGSWIWELCLPGPELKQQLGDTPSSEVQSLLYRAPSQISKSESVSRSALSASFATPWTIACQTPPSVEFSRHKYWSGLPFPSPGYLPDPGIKPGCPTLKADSLPSEPPEK